MIDNLLQYLDEAKIICPHKNKEMDEKKYKDYFSLYSKKKITINSIFKDSTLDNPIKRLVFGFRVALKLKREKNLIISRSLITSVFLTIFRVKHFLEIHQELKGLTRFLLINLNFLQSNHIMKIIFVSKSLSNIFNLKNEKYIVLHDGCDLRDFRFKRKLKKKIKNIYYSGSFYRGRGVELIKQLARVTPEYNYYLYGLRDEKIKSLKNFKVFSLVSYKKSIKNISNADLLLMPYQSKVSINSLNFNDDNSKFMSPLKMFEFLASGIPIISSDLKVLREILINRKNSILIKNYSNPIAWKKAINEIANNFNLRNKISQNSLLTAEKNTWVKRSETIYKIYLQKNDQYWNIK